MEKQIEQIHALIYKLNAEMQAATEVGDVPRTRDVCNQLIGACKVLTDLKLVNQIEDYMDANMYTDAVFQVESGTSTSMEVTGAKDVFDLLDEEEISESEPKKVVKQTIDKEKLVKWVKEEVHGCHIRGEMQREQAMHELFVKIEHGYFD